MKKRIFSLFLLFVMLLSLMPTAFAADREMKDAAENLYELGLFQGKGTDANGKPVYALDDVPSRSEAVTMLVRLLGKEAEAKAGSWDIPFSDVADWAKPYVGYAYANGLTTGTSATTFGGDAQVSPSQYLTFVLRALGYQSGTDFQWDKAWELSDQIGLTDGRYHAGTARFLRGDVALVSGSALGVQMSAGGQTLAEKLINDGVFTAQEYEKATEPPVILKEQYTDTVDVYFSIDGRMLGVTEAYRASSGSYVFTPYLRGERFTDFEVEVEYGSGSVKKNSDGTFTVKFPAKNSCDIALWYDIHEIEVEDENGEISTAIGRTKRSLTLSPPVPATGFVLARNGMNYLPGTGFGDAFTPYYVLDVYYNGERLEDYSVTTSAGSPFDASVQADGTLLLMKTGWGEGQFTVTYQGKSASFRALT